MSEAEARGAIRGSRLVQAILVNGLAASTLMPRRLRWLALRMYGVRLSRAGVAAGCYFGGRDVTIGRGAYINRGVFFDGLDTITIGPRVHVGMEVMILTGGHALGPSECRAAALVPGPVTVGSGSWIGARVIIMPGVEIGSGTVVAAGSVVTRSCEANALYAGVPAQKIKDLDVGKQLT